MTRTSADSRASDLRAIPGLPGKRRIPKISLGAILQLAGMLWTGVMFTGFVAYYLAGVAGVIGLVVVCALAGLWVAARTRWMRRCRREAQRFLGEESQIAAALKRPGRPNAYALFGTSRAVLFQRKRGYQPEVVALRDLDVRGEKRPNEWTRAQIEASYNGETWEILPPSGELDLLMRRLADVATPA